MYLFLERMRGIFRLLRSRRSAAPLSVALPRSLLDSPLDCLLSQSRPFGFDSPRILKRHLSVSFLERMRGIEPPLPAWEAGVLPLNHIRRV